MTSADLRSRLVAILAADAAGYSRLMAADDRATVAALDAARSVFRTRIEANQGRVIDMAGDSVLAVFETATGAVATALAVQEGLAGLIADVPEDRRMRFRIGVHLGDVIVKPDGTVYGDGVNIAARLQALAEPGGITISESIRTAVKGKLAASFEDQGEQVVKNIPDAVRAFRVRMHGVEAVQTVPARKSPSPAGEIDLPLPDKPSIAVLPFTNMSGDPEQEYFADGITEDIITELSRFQLIFVIARNTTFTFKGRSVDVQAVARQLGVHFVLEGSVRRSGQRVRVTAQLIDGQTGAHVWAERYEDIVDDVFNLQERVTRQIVSTMMPEVAEEEMRHLDRGHRRFSKADDIGWRALKAATDGFAQGKPELVREAIRLAREAIDLDLRCRLAWLVVSGSLTWQVFYGWAPDRSAALESAIEASDTLMALAPTDADAYAARGVARSMSGQTALGLADLRRAYELNPNNARNAFMLCWHEAADGNVERARTLAAQAIRNSPKDRLAGNAHLAYAMAAFVERDSEGMRDWAELAIQSSPNAPIRRVLMIAYAAEVGDAPLMRTHLDKLNSIAPDFLPSLFRGDYRPFNKAEHMAMLLDSLRKANLRDDSPGVTAP